MLWGKKLGKKMLIFELNFDLVLFPIVGTIFYLKIAKFPLARDFPPCAGLY